MIARAASAAELAVKKKVNKHDHLLNNYIFIPFAVETFGPWSHDAKVLVSQIGQILISITESTTAPTLNEVQYAYITALGKPLFKEHSAHFSQSRIVPSPDIGSLPSKETLRGHSDSSFRGEGYVQCCVSVRLCDMYSNQELAEIYFMYGKADGNAALARRLYQERYPQRQCPDRKTFVRLHYRLCEYGKFNSSGLGRGRPRSTTPEVQKEILEAVNMTPSISIRRVALQVSVPHTTVWRLLKEYQLNRLKLCQGFRLSDGLSLLTDGGLLCRESPAGGTARLDAADARDGSYDGRLPGRERLFRQRKTGDGAPDSHRSATYRRVVDSLQIDRDVLR
ncbi:hypothetical protein ANN_25064 [Periplaneta americana]|uniref:DUF4817 domain-containing protein n=1 Tax=Periplaneta americana TaxID=6978 RepID=A0ABQ8S0I8_PERAM|nr:hypothetical protein ANN_25064 [Periplaneta americana]